MDIVAKLRRHLDKHGYPDVEINVVGDVPWAKMNGDNELARSIGQTMEAFGRKPSAPLPFPTILSGIAMMLGGYWPAYLFTGDVLDIPIAMAFVGGAGNAHAANEFFVIEGAGTTFGMAASEKVVAASLYSYAGLNQPAP
jgi:hypothetical protein